MRFLFACLWLVKVSGAELQLEVPRLLPDGRVELRFNGDPSSYYRLLRGSTPDAIQQTVVIALTDPLTLASDTAAYFRLEQLPRSARLDTDGDGVDDVTELLGGTDPLIRDALPAGLTRVLSSPADGEEGVAVTRETVLRFSRALASGTTLGVETLFAESGGRRVLARVELSTDRRLATLFYLEPLPSGALVRVTLVGDKIRDADNKRVDADEDGQEGGLRVFQFSTVNNHSVPRTAVIGRVFASELVAGAGNVANTVNRPLEGVTITVDGMEESLRVVTDAAGNFRLTNSPAGRFFVHVDGRTAVGSQWPDGDYYPYVGKAWEAVAGREDTLANGTGEIYLPRIRAGTLEPVSNTRSTLVTFPAEVLAANSALEGVQLMVPPGALYDDNGIRGGRVGIAAVSPDRLPEPLPDGLRFPLVITVQTDGPSNFGEPVPVCFPNLPDPDTGLPLPPGAKSALWSFDHDEGTWNIVGGMTVSADGRLICSNPGVGIREPGWHGTRPGSAGKGGKLEEKKEEECRVLIIGPIGGTTNQIYRFSTSLSGGGSWSWSAPDGDPAFGSNSEFDVSFPTLGVHSITVRYTSEDGESECTDVHSIQITPEQCEVRIVGPVEFPSGAAQEFTSLVKPSGGRFRWKAPKGGSLFNEGNTPEAKVVWFSPGEYKLQLEYITNQGKPNEEVCQDEVTVFVREALTILDSNGRELNTSFESKVDEEVRVQGNLSSASGAYSWSAGPDGTVVTGGNSQFVTLRFSSAGIKTVQAVYKPFDTSKPEQRATATLKIRDLCSVDVTPPLTMTKVGASVLLQAHVDPSGGTVKWEAPDAQPSSGEGLSFSTVYAKNGFYPVNVIYTARSGEICTTAARVQVGPPVCDLTIEGPTLLQPGDDATYTIQMPNVAGLFAARLVETSENLGFQNVANGAPFVVATGFAFPGTYTLEAIFVGSRDTVVSLECRARLSIRVGSPSNASRNQARPMDDRTVASDRRLSTGRHYYARMNRKTGVVKRGPTGTSGIAHPRQERFAANESFIEYILNPETLHVGFAQFDSGAEGDSFELPSFQLGPDLSPDADGDGLSDLAEFILGTRADKADTDGDGISDAAEARAGTELLGKNAEAIGLVTSVATGGYAWDLAVESDRVLVAAGRAGLVVFNVFDPWNPVRVGALALPGDARAVASAGKIAAVALGENGMALVDVSELPAIKLRHHLAFGSEVSAVAIQGTWAVVGLSSGDLRIVNLESGAVISGVNVGGRVQDILIQGRMVYILGVAQGGMLLTTFDNSSGFPQFQSSLNLRGSIGAGQRRLRLASEGDRLFAVHTGGYAVVDLSNPAGPTLLHDALTAQFGWRQVASSGSGLLLAAADPNSTDDGDHDIQTYRLASDGAPSFDSIIPTPGSAESVVVAGNAGYAADGKEGLAVLRFQATDSRGVAPTVVLRGPVVDQRVEEGKLLNFQAIARDDIGVARVEFFVDGKLLATDSSFPYAFNWLTPRSLTGKETFRLQARATDTGGNVGVSEILVVGLAGDLTPPFVNSTGPASGAILDGDPVERVEVALSEPLNAESIANNSLRLFSSGPDGQVGTEDDAEIVGAVVGYRRQDNTVTLSLAKGLQAGVYRSRLEAGVRDRSGNALTTPYEWTFSVVPPRLVSLVPRPGGIASGSTLQATFRGSLDPATVVRSLEVASVGADGIAGTPDDVPVLGDVLYEVGSPLLRREFAPPLAPGRYVATLSGDVANGAGLKFGKGVTWEFSVVHTNLGTNTVELKGIVRGDFGVDEYGLVVTEAGPVVISNPRQLEVRILNAEGKLLALDSRPVFKTSFPSKGFHVLRVAKSAGDFGQDYSLLLKRYSTVSFSSNLTGGAPQTFAGRTPVSLGDEDEFRLTTEAGATYFLQATASGFPCPHRWTIFDTHGNPVRVSESVCGDGAVVTADQGGVVRVIFEAQSTTRAQLKVTRAQTRNYSIDLTSRDAFQSRGEAQFQGAKSNLNPGDLAVIEMTIPTGERFAFADPTGSFFCMAWRFVAPDGKELFSEPCERDQIPDTRAGGVYRLILVNTSSQQFAFGLELRRLITRTFEPVALPPGFVFESRQNLNGAGSRDQFDFDLEAGVPVAFAPGPFSACHLWQLSDPAGEIQFGPSTMCGSVVTYFPKVTGRHRLTVTGTRGSTSFAQDYLLKAGQPGVTTTHHDLSGATQFDSFSSSGLPGSRRVFEIQLAGEQLIQVSASIGAEGCSDGVKVRLVAPDGTILWRGDDGNRCNPRALIDAKEIGNYRLEIDLPADVVPDSFGVRVERLTQATGHWVTQNASRNPLLGPGTALLVRNEGEEVYLAGPFAQGKGIARAVSDGWDLLGIATRADEVEVRVLDLVHDGTALYVAGNFTAINGTPANGVARWDGSKWESLGSGIRVTSDDVGNRLLEVRALGFLGVELYATGVFRQSGDVATFNLSRWDGSKWNAVPIGFFTPRDGIGGELDPLSFASSGSAISVVGETLYAGGQFLFPGRNLGAWKDGQFTGSLLGGVDVSNFESGSVRRLRNADNQLYVMGEFQRAGVDFGRIDANGFAVWDGAVWQKPVAEFPRFGVNDFDVQGARIAIGGSIASLFSFVEGNLVSSTPVQGVGLWDGKRWGSLGRGVEQVQNPDGDSIKFLPGEVHRLQLSGRRLYVTGMFTRAGGIPTNFYGVWENAP